MGGSEEKEVSLPSEWGVLGNREYVSCLPALMFLYSHTSLCPKSQFMSLSLSGMHLLGPQTRVTRRGPGGVELRREEVRERERQDSSDECELGSREQACGGWGGTVGATARAGDQYSI